MGVPSTYVRPRKREIRPRRPAAVSLAVALLTFACGVTARLAVARRAAPCNVLSVNVNGAAPLTRPAPGSRGTSS